MAAFSRGDLKCYVCVHVFVGALPVLLVAHESDGAWSFVCGGVHPDSPESYRVVGVGHLLGRDPSLHDCADLPEGFEAERAAVGEPWIRTEISSDAC
jgi:hypothetical protein